MPDLAALSLFSGIGGIDLAAEAAGIRTVAMCEKDPFCREVLRKHWPNIPIFGDIKELGGDDIGSPIDVVHGGPPCQPVSVVGRRRGKDDERYLWGEVFRVVADVMPRFCVFENVPGILGIAGDEICQELERVGYSVGICCFEAAAVGAPHRRMRVFFVAHANGVGCSPLKEPQGLSRAVGPVRHSNAFPHPARRRCGQGAAVAGRDKEGSGPRAWDRPSVARPDFPDADRERELQPGGSEREVGGWPGDFREAASDADSERREKQRGAEPENGERAALGRAERRGGGIVEPGVGGMADGISAALDGYWRREPNIPRTARGVKNRVSRLRALGNSCVPAQIYPIFRAIAEAENER